MNQILVTEKLYVTPELRRKKMIYKINFIVSIVMIIILCSFYIHSEYARNKEQELSEDLLAEMIDEEVLVDNEPVNNEQVDSEQEDNEDIGVWKITISSAQKEEQPVLQNETNPLVKSRKGKETKKVTTYITGSDGKRYPSVGRIQIPKINVDYAILSETSVAWLKISPCKFYGPDLNEIGNVSIAGHNYRNKKFFSKVPTLENGDIIKITDVTGRKITYKIYDQYTVEPTNTNCIYPISGKEDKRIITLITCTNDSKKRVITHAEEV